MLNRQKPHIIKKFNCISLLNSQIKPTAEFCQIQDTARRIKCKFVFSFKKIISLSKAGLSPDEKKSKNLLQRHVNKIMPLHAPFPGRSRLRNLSIIQNFPLSSPFRPLKLSNIQFAYFVLL